MRFIHLFALLSSSMSIVGAESPLAALARYSGAWQIMREGGATDRLENRCTVIGKFYACDQSVNDASTGLLVIGPDSDPSHYFMQIVKPDGRATGRDELAIDGDTWTFTSQRRDGYGKNTYFRTVNTFTGKDRIHFEQSESPDRKQWTVKASGDEVRVAGRPARK